MPVPTVACPKCKGGCDLCGGSGRVNESVGRIYVREETRRTARMPGRQLENFLTEEVPTRPDLIGAADRRRRIGLALIAIIGLATGIGAGLLLRALL